VTRRRSRRIGAAQVLGSGRQELHPVLARIAEEKFGWDPAPLRELIEWAEIIDGALFPNPQMAVALDDEAMQLMLLIEATRDPALLPRLIRELSSRPLSDVLRERG